MTLRARVREKKLTFGSWITLAHTAVAEIMANAGYDWLVIDLEHSAISIREAQELIRVVDLCGVVPLVRLSENNPTEIKRVMDAGAHGIIVPMVNDAAQAKQAVAATRYPPLGKRGVGLARAQGYGTTFDAYREWLEHESLVIVQIEHIEAVNHLEEILNVDGVDGFLVGPYDLSGSLGVPGKFNHPVFLEALKQIETISRMLPVGAGYHVVPPRLDLVKEKVAEGYTFVACSTDFLFLGETCRQHADAVKALVQS
jgi:2-keto-3-deoxy-L-rhamnonate aldolase RhmA